LRPEEMATRYAFDGMDMLHGPYTLVAVVGDTIRGHITVGGSRDEDAVDSAEIWSLYVDPPYWGSGVSAALLTAGCNRLSRVGHEQAFLWVLATNMRARRFYERNGWTTDGVEKPVILGGASVHQVRYVTALRRQT
jgi:GNAT superfamily N-acetyltransferase